MPMTWHVLGPGAAAQKAREWCQTLATATSPLGIGKNMSRLQLLLELDTASVTHAMLLERALRDANLGHP